MSGQIIGFNITKIEAEKKEIYSKPSINTNIEFINVEKEQIDIIKDLEVVKINFKFSISYTEKEEKTESEKKESGKINLEGSLLLSFSVYEIENLKLILTTSKSFIISICSFSTFINSIF